MSKITEIIPDDAPDWAMEAIDNGNLFRVAFEKVAVLERENELLNKVVVIQDKTIS